MCVFSFLQTMEKSVWLISMEKQRMKYMTTSRTHSVIQSKSLLKPPPPRGSVLPGSLKIMHWSPQISEKKSSAPWKYFANTNSFLTISHFCRLLITFANSLYPDQDWQIVGPDLGPNHFTFWEYSWNIFWKKLFFKKKKSQQTTTKTWKKNAKS